MKTTAKDDDVTRMSNDDDVTTISNDDSKTLCDFLNFKARFFWFESLKKIEICFFIFFQIWKKWFLFLDFPKGLEWERKRD